MNVDRLICWLVGHRAWGEWEAVVRTHTDRPGVYLLHWTTNAPEEARYCRACWKFQFRLSQPLCS